MLSAFKLVFFATSMTLLASQADAMCGRQPEIKLSGGTVVCLLDVSTTVITRTVERRGSGIKPRQTSANKAGRVVVKVPSDKIIPARRLHPQARALCKQFKGEILKKVGKPAFPFMVVSFVFGDKPKLDRYGKPKSVNVYLGRGCGVRG